MTTFGRSASGRLLVPTSRGGGRARVSAVSTPVISSIDPTSGATSGGETLTVWGSFFLNGDLIRIDGSNQATTFVNSGKLTCTTPGHGVGSVNVVVRRGVTDSNAATFEFLPGGGLPADVVFASGWETATGTSAAALRDTDKTVPWTTLSGTGFEHEVRTVAGDSLDFPTANYLAVRGHPDFGVGGGGSRHITASGIISTPGVGDKVALRFYRRWLAPTDWNGDNETHGNYFGPGGWGPVALGFWDRISSSGQTYEVIVSAGSSQNPRYFQPYDGGAWKNFAFSQTLRWEVLYTHSATNAYTLEARLYDINDTLLYTTADFVERFTPRTATLANTTFSQTAGGSGGMLDLITGINGWGGNPPDAQNNYYGITAVLARAGSTADWCGPYQAAEATWSP